MIQVSLANNPKYNTDDLSLELKHCMKQIATTENLRDQLVGQIYLITSIQKAINDNSIKNNLDGFLKSYNDSISDINGAILSKEDKVSYFDIEKEKSSYEKQNFTIKLASKCQEVEKVFDKVAILNAQAINQAKKHISPCEKKEVDFTQNININNAIITANN